MDGSDGDERVDERMERCFNLLATSECSKRRKEKPVAAWQSMSTE